MIALDTNVLVRLLLHDDVDQARVAERVIATAKRHGTPLFIPDVVLCELVWVLSRRANLRRATIADALDWLLNVESVVLADTTAARHAVASFRDGTGDFADYLIREQAMRAGAAEVVTFDRGLKGETGFRLLTQATGGKMIVK